MRREADCDLLLDRCRQAGRGPARSASRDVRPGCRLLALVDVATEASGLPLSPRYSTSIQISSFLSVTPSFTISMVAVTDEPVVSFQIEMGKHSKGLTHFLLAVVVTFQEIGVVPSLAPPLRMMVVSVFRVPQ